MSTADRVLDALQPFSLKRERDQYRCNSPFRPGADSMTFVVKITSPEHGTFFDFRDDADPKSGSLYDLAKQLGVAIPATIPVGNSKRAYDGLEDYARAHGLTVDALRSWQWRETTYQGRPALEFPTPSGLRWRFIDGNKPPYKSVDGYTRCWYGLGSRLKELLADKQPLVICNGEISTIAARAQAVASLAMTSGEKGEIPQDLLEQLQGFLADLDEPPSILIALDCDKPGRSAARGLEAQLLRAGFQARAVDLGLGSGGDLADFCMIHAPDAGQELVKLQTLPPVFDNSRWRFASIDEVLRMAPIDWLVPRQIPARGLTMLYGASGTYKSFFILDHALKLALEGINILYIAAEGEYGYRQRLEAWIKHHQAKPSAITFVLGQVDLFDEEELTEFSRLIETFKPKMIVVDTFAMCSGMADENNTRDMLTVVNGCMQMSRQLEAVIVIVHHTNAEGKKERGNKSLRNSCDTVIRVSLEDDLVSVQSQKTKDTKPFETYLLAPISIDLGYRNNIGETVTSVVLLPSDKVVRGDELTPMQRAVIEVIAVEPNATLADIAEAVEADHRGVVGKVISALVKKGYVRINATGGRDLTPEGQNIMSAGDSLTPSDSLDSLDSYGLQNRGRQKTKESEESEESRESGSQSIPLWSKDRPGSHYDKEK